MTSKSEKLPGMSVQRLSDADGYDYIRLTFPKSGNREGGEIVESLSILGQPQALKNELLRRGYKLDPGLSAPSLVAELQHLLPDDAKPLFTETGWITHRTFCAFAFPDEVIGDMQAELLVTENVRANSIASGGTKGSLRNWRKRVARRALKSQAASLAIMTSLASPLLRYSELSESFTFNIAGESSSGKSTAISAAISVWGNPKNCLSWDATDGAIGDLAVANSGFGLFLDDVEKQAGEIDVKVRRVRDMIHKIVAGRTRHRSAFASRDPALQSKTYECIAFCSSPDTLANYSRRARKTLQPSESVRFLEIRVPPGDEGGIFATAAAGGATNDSFTAVKELKVGCDSNYGKAGRKWVRYLVKNAATLRQKVAALTREFRELLGSVGVGAIEGRIADKFALVHAAGLLASQAGVLPWSKKTIKAVSVKGYRDAIAAGFPDRFDPNAALLRLKAFLETDKVKKTKKQLNSLRRGGRTGYLTEANLFLRRDAFERVLADTSTRAPSSAEYEGLCTRLRNSGALLKGHRGRTRDVWVAGAKAKYLVFSIPELNAEFRSSESAFRSS